MKFIYLSTCKFSLVSASIRFSTRCAWSHAGFYNTDDGSYLSAQLKGGVQLRFEKPLPEEYKECFSKRLLLTAPGVEEAYKWALTQIGKPYDWKAILGIATDQNWHCGEDYFCSELVAAAFETIGEPLLNPYADVWRITPCDIWLSPKVSRVQ